MKRWIAPLGSPVGVAGVAALALFLAGVFDGNDASGGGGNGAEVAGVCVEGNPDCGDTGFVTDDDGGDTVAPGCEVGHVGVCDDTPIADGETGDLFEGDGPALQPACAPGFPDCADTLVLPDNGEEVEDKVVPIGTFDDDHDRSGASSEGDSASGGATASVDPLTTAGSDTPTE